MDSSSRYRVLCLIGSGGMAQVYEGTLVGARGFERRVAIKRVLPQHAHDEAAHRTNKSRSSELAKYQRGPARERVGVEQGLGARLVSALRAAGGAADRRVA